MMIGSSHARWIPRWIAGAALLLLVIGSVVVVFPSYAASGSSGRSTLHGHLVPALKHTHAHGPTAGAHKLQLAVALNPGTPAG